MDNFIEDTYKPLQDDLNDAKDDRNDAYTTAISLENSMYVDGYYISRSFNEGDPVTFIEEGLSFGEKGSAWVAVEGAEALKWLEDGAVLVADGSYQTAYNLIDDAINLAKLDFSAQLQIDVDLFASVGLQIDFELDLGSVDTDIDYQLTSQT